VLFIGTQFSILYTSMYSPKVEKSGNLGDTGISKKSALPVTPPGAPPARWTGLACGLVCCAQVLLVFEDSHVSSVVSG
jgi:hypothetical protein